MLSSILKSAIFKAIGIKIFEMVLNSVVWPWAEEFVKKTSNTYDEKVLARFKVFLTDVLKDIKE